MKQRILALRYVLSVLAISLSCTLVGLAQQTAPAPKTMPAGSAMNQSADGARTTMIAEWTRAKDYTKEYLDAMPEDGLGFKPTPEIRSFAEQMLHLAAANFSFASMATGATNPYQGKNLEKIDEYKASKAALTKIVLESYDFMISGIKGLETSKIGEELKLPNRPAVTRSLLLAKAFEHQTHHRGQTTIYLRLKGVKPPNERLF